MRPFGVRRSSISSRSSCRTLRYTVNLYKRSIILCTVIHLSLLYAGNTSILLKRSHIRYCLSSLSLSCLPAVNLARGVRPNRLPHQQQSQQWLVLPAVQRRQTRSTHFRPSTCSMPPRRGLLPTPASCTHHIGRAPLSN